MGREIEASVLAVDPDLALVRLTRKDAGAIAEQLSLLAVGQRVQCVVTDIADFGLFAAVGAVEGLIRASHLDRPGAAGGYQVGDRLEAEVIEIRPERGQLTLSRRFVADEAVDTALSEVTVGDIVEAVVSSVAPMGVFVQFQGITGLVHRSELSWMHDRDPDDFVVGSQLPAKIIAIDQDRRRVSLSFKQLTVDAVD